MIIDATDFPIHKSATLDIKAVSWPSWPPFLAGCEQLEPHEVLPSAALHRSRLMLRKLLRRQRTTRPPHSFLFPSALWHHMQWSSLVEKGGVWGPPRKKWKSMAAKSKNLHRTVKIAATEPTSWKYNGVLGFREYQNYGPNRLQHVHFWHLFE